MTREMCAAPDPSPAVGPRAARGRPRVGCAPGLRLPRCAAVCVDARVGWAIRRRVSQIAPPHPTSGKRPAQAADST